MKSQRATRGLILGGSAVLVAIGALAGCSSSTEKESPTSVSPTTSSSAPAPSPTEKAIGPGDNSFTPSIDPTPPGAVCKEIVNGVCIR